MRTTGLLSPFLTLIMIPLDSSLAIEAGTANIAPTPHTISHSLPQKPYVMNKIIYIKFKKLNQFHITPHVSYFRPEY